MSLKNMVGSFGRAMAQLPLIADVVHSPKVRDALVNLPGMSAIYRKGVLLCHPFDRQMGIETSGVASSEDLPDSAFTTTKTCVYAGSQPSIIRAALEALPPVQDFTFVDLGCGKGRPLIVASEYPFRAVIGVEFSPPLAEIAGANLEIVRRKFPSRPPLRVEIGDAGAYAFPSGNLVVFAYNPFGEEIMQRVVAALESTLAAEQREIYFVYYNPVWGKCLDASRAFRRYFAAMIPYAKVERGYGYDASDAVVIWRSGQAELSPGADAAIKIVELNSRAELAGATAAGVLR